LAIRLRIYNLKRNYFLNFFEQQSYISIIEKIKATLEQVKEYVQKHSLKEITEQFTTFVKQIQEFVRNLSTEKLTEYIKEVLEQLKDYIINTDFGSLEPYIKAIKEILKNLDVTEYAKQIAKILEQYKKDILDFDPDKLINEVLEILNEIKDKILDPEKEKKLIEDFRKEMQEEKHKIVDLDVEEECERMRFAIDFLVGVIQVADLSEYYNRIKTYYPIIRMFFLFFDPSQIVKIVREALIKTKEFAEKIDAEVVYAFLKKSH
jgi:HPt (histidine-containing phosphotransfer) domain-containing protein